MTEMPRDIKCARCKKRYIWNPKDAGQVCPHCGSTISGEIEVIIESPFLDKNGKTPIIKVKIDREI